MRCDSVSPIDSRKGTVKVSVLRMEASVPAAVPLAMVSTPPPTLRLAPGPISLVHLPGLRSLPVKLSRHFLWTDFTLSMSSTGS